MENEAVVYIKGLLRTEVFNDDSDVSPALAYAVLDWLEKAAKGRKAKLRDRVILEVAERGEPTKSGRKLWENNAEILHSIKKAKVPADKDLKAYLKGKDVAFTEVYDAETVFVLNPSKLDRLIMHGRIDEDEINALRKETDAISASLKGDLKAGLDELLKG